MAHDDAKQYEEKPIFDGSDPGKYRSWKRKSRIWLLGLPNTVGADKFG